MNTFTIGYTLVNRGRSIENTTQAISQYIKQNPNFILFLDETDATDKDKGLNGRKIFKELKKLPISKNIVFEISDDLDVGLNYIHSKSFKIKREKIEQINKNDLKFPQGKSEHYKHHRKIVYTKVFNTDVNFIVQHNSAFIRPFRRYLQSVEALKIQKRMQTINNLTFLIRDQNTWIPGEGRLERFLRRKYKVECLTDIANRKYKLEELEGDTGGLNRLTYNLIRSGIAPFISKHIITIMDKVESICISKETLSKEILNYKTTHTQIEGLDHGLISTQIDIR